MKPGYQTTEFWLTVVSNGILIVTAMKGSIPADKAATILAVLNGVYATLRTISKGVVSSSDAPK